MKHTIGTILLTFVLVTLMLLNGQAQLISDDIKVKVRVRNGSKFLITKLRILDNNFENIKSGDTSEYVDVEPFYPSMDVDVTILRHRTFGRNLLQQVIIYPVDNVGEKVFTNERNTIVINVFKGKEKGQIDVDTNVIPE